MAVAQKIAQSITQSSWIRKMFEEGNRLKQIYGEDQVYDFSLGNPQLEPPAQVKERLLEIINEQARGMHGYMPNAGYPETRRAVAEFLNREQGLNLTQNHVIMTCGAGGALNVILKTLIDPGEEVVIPTPFFVEYRFYVDNAGGKTVLVKSKEDFSLDLAALGEAITEKTKIVLINSPNNPTGRIYTEEELSGLALILKEKGLAYGRQIYLVSDEPYRELAFDQVKVGSVLNLYHNSIVAYSYSKSLSLAGERIGYIAVSPALSDLELTIDGLTLCNRILGFVNAPALMQRVVARLQGVAVDVSVYQRKRDLFCNMLGKIGYTFNKPQGAFYLFPRSPLADDVEFIRILQSKRILAVPGSGFGGPGHFRLAFCVSDETILAAEEGFASAFNECRQGK